MHQTDPISLIKFHRNDHDVNEVVRKHLYSIRDYLLSNYPKMRSITLYGSYTTGDFLFSRKNGNISLISDFDLFLTGDPWIIWPIKLKSLNYRRNIFDGVLLDVVIESIMNLKRMNPVMENVNLKHTGKVIWGENILSLMPQLSSNTLSLGQGIRLLFNRMWGLLETYFTNQEDLTLINNRSAKAVVSCAQSLLVLSNSYQADLELVLKSIDSELNKSFNKKYPTFVVILHESIQFLLYQQPLPYSAEAYRKKAGNWLLTVLSYCLGVKTTCEIGVWNEAMADFEHQLQHNRHFLGNALSFNFRCLRDQKRIYPRLAFSGINKPIAVYMWTSWLYLFLALTCSFETRNTYLNKLEEHLTPFCHKKRFNEIDNINILYNLIRNLNSLTPVTEKI
ncbi:hypothetical protein ACFLT7_02580 [candidate division KSB1 bacterium]